jgi:integrase
MISTPTKTAWHKRPDPKEICSICEAPIYNPATGYVLFTEHRAVAADEDIDADWIARKKSPAGWEYVHVHRDNPKAAVVKVKVKRPKVEKPSATPLRHVGNARRNSLVRYYHHQFAPAKLADNSPYTGRQYERALFKLCEYAQRDVTIGECNDLFIDKFFEWCIRDAGLKFETVRKYRAYLRRIVREARPGCCEKESGKRPHETEAVGVDETTMNVEGSLWRFLHEFYKPNRLVGRPECSTKSYEYALKRLYRHIGRSVSVSELTDELVTDHMQWILNSGLAVASANNSRLHLLALWRYAYKKKLIDTRPDVEKLPEPKRLPKAWAVAEVGQILEACREQKGVISGIPAAKWWRAFILVLYDTGLRRRAATLLQRTDLDFTDGMLTVRPEDQKQNAEQQFRLSAETLAAIREIWLPERRLLFAWSRERKRIWIDYGEILKRAGLSCTNKDKFHKIRRTTATHIAATAGIAAACHHLGHSSEAMTKRYIDPRFTQTRDGVDFLPRPK